MNKLYTAKDDSAAIWFPLKGHVFALYTQTSNKNNIIQSSRKRRSQISPFLRILLFFRGFQSYMGHVGISHDIWNGLG